MRLIYLLAGVFAFLLGILGIVLPVLPAVPFMLVAAFFFARSNPAWEARLLNDPRFGPSIRAWRDRGALGLGSKIAALIGLTSSAIAGLVFVDAPWQFAPLAIALLCGAWVLSRPTA